MKTIHIPQDDSLPITAVDVGENEWGMPDVFGEAFIERVRFSVPQQLDMYRTGTEDDPKWVVMLVDEDGIPKGLSQNARASILYQSGRHLGIIYGEAYLVMEYRDPMEGGIWSDIVAPFDEPDFWQRLV